MIHFYERNIVNDVSSETWINELSSMVAEDLIARKLEVDGPRGVSWTDGSATLRSYSIAYAYGAYLSRNFGGARFTQALLKSSSPGVGAVTDALEALGYAESFDDTLPMWGIANLLSDTVSVGTGYELNRGTWFDAGNKTNDYDLGSINLYKYEYLSQEGPWLWSLSNLPSSLYGHSNVYVSAGSFADDISGSWDITLPSNVGMTVLVKVGE